MSSSFRVAALAALTLPALAANDVRGAAERAIALIQRVNAQWKTPCISCHHQIMGALALADARAHGLAVDEKAAQAATLSSFKLLHDFDAAIRIENLIDPAMSEGAMLMGAHAAGIGPSLVTEAYARHVAGNQMPDGHWMIFDARPPSSHSEITATATAVKSLVLYHPRPAPYLERARRWLAQAQAMDTEGAVFQLLGLSWAGASRSDIAGAAARLEARQEPNGSWAHRAGNTPDAYSTGQALYALRHTNAWAAGEARFQAGLRWLIGQQKPDGSWHVKTRLHSKAPISPPYFESGFPYGHDQFISMTATAWAIRALAEALPVAGKPSQPLPVPAFDASKLGWARAALSGSLDELAKIDPNAATPGGTTALMVAAGDAAKVELLLKRGANPKAVTRAGYDALMMASLFHGNSRAASLLLAAGIPAAPNRKTRFDASALALAVMSNDPVLAELLLTKGARVNQGMRLLGGSTPSSLLVLASSFGNQRLIRTLVKAGAPVDATDEFRMTALSWAALAGRVEAVRALLELRANPRHRDSFGLTPLGHTKAIEGLPEDAATLLAAL